jgi:hypothetical protein
MEERSEQHPVTPAVKKIVEILQQKPEPDLASRRQYKDNLKESLIDFLASIGAEENQLKLRFSCLPQDCPFNEMDLPDIFKDPNKETPFEVRLVLYPSGKNFAIEFMGLKANGPWGKIMLDFWGNPKLEWDINPASPRQDEQFKTTKLYEEIVEKPDSKESVEFFGKFLSFIAQHA